MDIGSRIKQIKGKMTTRELAEKIGVTREFLSAVENNLKQASLQAITNICEVLGYSLEEFFALDLTPEEKELLDNVKGLNEEQMKALNVIVKSMKR